MLREVLLQQIDGERTGTVWQAPKRGELVEVLPHPPAPLAHAHRALHCQCRGAPVV